LSQANVEAVPKNSLPTYIFSFFCVRNTLLILAQVFYVHPIYSSLNARHYLSHPKKRGSKIKLFFISVFTSLDSEMQTPDYNLPISRHSTKFPCPQFLSC
jgi:hypothetical protein